MEVIINNLICPRCKSNLIFCKNIIKCEKLCAWSIVNGIPRILNYKNNYTDPFGLQWKKYIKTQLDSYTNTTISINRLIRCLGKALEIIKSGKEVNILEVGCGAGRFTEILLSYENCKLTSIDYSNAVEANQQNFPQGKNHLIIQNLQQ